MHKFSLTLSSNSCFCLFQRYFLRCARAAGSSQFAVPPTIKWLCEPEGHHFFVHGSWACETKQSLFAGVANAADPLAFIMKAFREQLLEKAVFTLVTPGYEMPSVVGPNKGTNG